MFGHSNRPQRHESRREKRGADLVDGRAHGVGADRALDQLMHAGGRRYERPRDSPAAPRNNDHVPRRRGSGGGRLKGRGRGMWDDTASSSEKDTHSMLWSMISMARSRSNRTAPDFEIELWLWSGFAPDGRGPWSWIQILETRATQEEGELAQREWGVAQLVVVGHLIVVLWHAVGYGSLSLRSLCSCAGGFISGAGSSCGACSN